MFRCHHRSVLRTVVLSLEPLEDRLVPALLGQQLFPSDNPWNQRIADAPVAVNSTAIINNIVNRSGNGRLHPDFSEDFRDSRDLYGIPYNIVHGNSQPKVRVVLDAYDDESDLSDVPIPANAVIEGDYQNRPKDGVDARGDSHLLIWDQDNNIGYELYRASRPSENGDGQWHADQLTVWNMKTNQFRRLGWTSADAAGLAILPGLVRPDEGLPASQGGQGVINHAIRMTLQNAIILNQYLFPASHTANPGNTNAAIMPPMGARFRLKASVDISQLNPQAKIVAQAMKDYGLIVADNGSNFYFSGASYAVDASNGRTLTWDDDDVQSSTRGLKSLHFADFEVVDLTPIVTGLSTTQAQAGTRIDVLGQNFSGGAGRIQVLFGTTPGTNVTVVHDGKITVTVPAGTGTVDVRVQSGVNASGNPSNIKNPIFGYGTSAVSANARFTYGQGGGGGGGTNQPPTVAVAAKATPTPVTGLTTTLSVLGADDGGEGNLTYTWQVLSGPAGVVFGSNGTNTAKTTSARFSQAGNYRFRATITDAAGLTSTSDVTVQLNQTLTSLQLRPARATIRPGGKVQFAAVALDQFGLGLAIQPTFTWSLISGRGSVSRTGLYKAPANKKGTAVVEARAGNVKATAIVSVSSARRAAKARSVTAL